MSTQTATWAELNAERTLVMDRISERQRELAYLYHQQRDLRERMEALTRERIAVSSRADNPADDTWQYARYPVTGDDVSAPAYDTREQLLTAVRDTRNELDDLVDAADPERMAQPFSIGQWSVKDVLAHLTLWRTRTADILEAGLTGYAPVAPWPARFGETETEEQVQAINAWNHTRHVATPLVGVLQASDVQFERVEQLLATLPDAALFTVGRFDWLPDVALGPAVIGGMLEHWQEHEAELRAWLNRDDDKDGV